MNEDRIWILMTRKLSGTATEDELKELQSWLQSHPDSTYSLQLLSDLWKSETSKEEPDAEEAFNRHLARMAFSSRPASPSGTPSPSGAASSTSPSGAEIPSPASHGSPASITSTSTHPIPGSSQRRRPFFSWAASRDLTREYIRTAFRSLWRQKGFSLLNISGLTIGIASAVLLFLWIHNEVTSDRFYKNEDRLYQVFGRSVIDGKVQCYGSTAMVLGPLLKSNYAHEVEEVVRTNWVGAFILTYGDQHIQTYGFLADSGFLKLFDFPLLHGDPATALKSPHSIVLTRKTAKRLFGTDDVMGQVLRIDSNALFTVTGVLQDMPPNTQFQLDYLVPWSYTKEVGWEDDNWSNHHISTFVLLKPGISEAAANDDFRNIIRQHARDVNEDLFLHPAAKWRLYSQFENGKITDGEIRYVRMILLVAGFILLIACINYMNLSTARSMRRAREVGIRKVIGAGRGSLIGRFLGESFLTTFLSGTLALIVVQLSLPWFDELVGRNLSIPYADPRFWGLAAAFIGVIGLLAGSYPALYLSAYKPIDVLKGYFKGMTGLIAPRKILVVIQFTFAIAFIICTIVIHKQISFIWHRETGYNQDNLVFTFIKGDVRKKYEVIRQELLNSGLVTEVIRTNSPVTDIWSGDNDYSWQGRDPNFRSQFVEFYSDHAFAATLGLKIIAGRDIDIYRYPTDSSAIVLTESALRTMGFANPIGQYIRNQNNDWHVVGVVHDFVTGTPFYPTSPILIKGPIGRKDNYWFGTVTCRLSEKKPTKKDLAKMTAIFKKYNPDYPFEYKFVGNFYAQKFEGEQSAGSLATLFAGFSILISCLGLFGLAAHTAESRTREVGIRKVLGASVVRIVSLLSKDFLLLVAIAFVIATPIAWWYMNNWLEGYPYRVTISWWIFALAGGLTVFIAAVTVGFQAIRAAMTNPVKILRSE